MREPMRDDANISSVSPTAAWGNPAASMYGPAVFHKKGTPKMRKVKSSVMRDRPLCRVDQQKPWPCRTPIDILPESVRSASPSQCRRATRR